MKVLKVINPELGWDNVICLADSMEAAAFYMDCKSVEELNKMVESNEIRIYSEEIETLPEGCSTLEEALNKLENDTNVANNALGSTDRGENGLYGKF